MGSFLSFIADKTEFNPNKDNQELRICDYIDPSSPLPPTPSESNETTDLRCVISGNKELRNGYKRPYTVTFTDKNGNPIDWQKVDYQWNIVSNFKVEQNSYENKIDLFVDNEKLINSSFLLQVSIKDQIISELGISIHE